MLIFKKNIYEGYGPSPDLAAASNYPSGFSPLEMIKTALEEESGLIDIIFKQPPNFWKEDAKRFYPNAYKTGDLYTLKNFREILLEGLSCEDRWFYMNTYHFCILYDIIFRYSYNYNHDSSQEKLKALPDLHGAFIPFKRFIQDYFFNTVFLIDPEVYNAMASEEKILKGYTCPCQFAVINGLAPTREEMELRVSKDFPYQLYV